MNEDESISQEYTEGDAQQQIEEPTSVEKKAYSFDDLKNYVDTFKKTVPQNASAYEVLGVSSTSTWQEIDETYQEFKELFRTANLEQLGNGLDILSTMSEFQAVFSKIYTAYEQLKQNAVEIKKALEEAETIVDALQILGTLLEQGIYLVRIEESENISVAGMFRYIDQVHRLALSFPREDVNHEYIELIPQNFGLREMVEDDSKELQILVVELLDATTLARMYAIVETLMARGYKYLPKINTADERKYHVNMENELAIISEQMEEEENYGNAFLKARRRVSPQYRFGGRPLQLTSA